MYNSITEKSITDTQKWQSSKILCPEFSENFSFVFYMSLIMMQVSKNTPTLV